MRLNKSTTYAIEALTALAKATILNSRTVSTMEISNENKLPHSFVEQIFRQLRLNAIVQSKKGPRGGYRLARPVHTITLKDIHTTFETIDTGNAGLDKAVEQYLSSVTLEDLIVEESNVL
jgi:Rrf2 family iron-sulfur cluster assembly transcriptional regulator